MFSGLKNKIKEETGSEVSLITTCHRRSDSTTSLGSFTIDSSPEDVTSQNPNIRHSDGKAITPKEFKQLQTKEEEWRKKLQKRDDEWGGRVKKLEESWKKKVEEKEKEILLLSKKVESQEKELEVQKNMIKEYQEKMCKYREELDEVEGFQTQETSKMKHLLLSKEQTIAELKQELKELRAADAQLQLLQDTSENLRRESASLRNQLASQDAELRTLRGKLELNEVRQQFSALNPESVDQRVHGLLAERVLLERLLSETHEHLAEVKNSWSATIAGLETQVARLASQNAQETVLRRKVEEENEKLVEEVEGLRDTVIGLNVCDGNKLQGENSEVAGVMNKLEKTLEEEQAARKSLEESSKKEKEDLEKRLKTANQMLVEEISKRETFEEERNHLAERYAKERKEKDELMMRNAQISQETELVRQQLAALRRDSSHENEKLQEEILSKDQTLKRVQEELEQRAETCQSVALLEEEIADKNKVIKSLQQRVSDMRKALHRELKANDFGGADFWIKEGSIPSQGPAILPTHSELGEDINFVYLKHVLMKFLTSREYEAQQLTKAVATLLRFSAEEEQFLRETLQWKMSWFGSRPRLAEGIQFKSPSR